MGDQAAGAVIGSGSCREMDQSRVFTLDMSGCSLERAGQLLSFVGEPQVNTLVFARTRPAVCVCSRRTAGRR